jgi:hypothetical protein
MDWYYSGGGKPVGPHSADDIESLFVTGQINSDTMIWRKGMPQWAPLADVPDFAGLQSDDLPPPLPPMTQPKSPAPEPTRAEREAIGESDEVDLDDDGKPDREPIFNFSEASLTPNLAGPWTRYFARSIDLTVIGSVLLTTIYWVLPSISPAAYLQVYAVDGRAWFLIMLPFAHFINAIIITLAGNSLGKAIFGIKVEPLPGRDRFTFSQNLSREFRVYTQGMAFGIPLVNLITMIPAFRAVSSTGQAPYDFRIATVQAYSTSKFRRTLGMLFAVSLYFVIAYANAADRISVAELERSTTWTNPETQRTATIPPGWQYEPVTAPDGAQLHGFVNAKTGMVALLGVETSANVDMTGYTTALSNALASTADLGRWSISGMPGVWRVSGQMRAEAMPNTIYVAQSGDQFWRIVYIDQINKTLRDIVEPEMTSVLFGSAGIRAGQ